MKEPKRRRRFAPPPLSAPPVTKDRKTVYVNDHPVQIFLWAEVQHCVNAYDSDLFLAVQRGDADIVDALGGRIGWGGFAGEGQHIYVRFVSKEEAG